MCCYENSSHINMFQAKKTYGLRCKLSIKKSLLSSIALAFWCAHLSLVITKLTHNHCTEINLFQHVIKPIVIQLNGLCSIPLQPII